MAVNPYKMFDIYGLDQVKLYEGRILGTLPPSVLISFAYLAHKIVTRWHLNRNIYKFFLITNNLSICKKLIKMLMFAVIFRRHLFAVGSSAYSQVTAANNASANQVVVISGESGSGKTESTKLVMQYLAAVNRAPNNLVTEQILEATPLLESFGNAKTPRNDNSSRFGKYLEVHFRE